MGNKVSVGIWEMGERKHDWIKEYEESHSISEMDDQNQSMLSMLQNTLGKESTKSLKSNKRQGSGLSKFANNSFQSAMGSRNSLKSGEKSDKSFMTAYNNF